MEGKIFNITRFCTDDGPGIRTTVFLKGCPLRCIWCHNPESQRTENETYCTGETVGQTMTAAEVFEEIKRDKVFYQTSGGGVTISGGEPLFQPAFTAEILKLCRENGIHTAIETSGFANEQSLMCVVRFCDLVLYDIKETDEKKHIQFTGVSPEIIWKNLSLIANMHIPFIIRLPIIPGLNDRKMHFLKVRSLVANMHPCRIEIMPYHTLGVYKYQQLGRTYRCSLHEPTEQQINAWKQWLSEPREVL